MSSRRLLFELSGLVGGGDVLGGEHVPGEVHAGGCEVLAEGVGRLEVDAREHTFLEVGRHGLACLVVAGVVVEDLGDGGKRLVELRRHLDEVACYAGAA